MHLYQAICATWTICVLTIISAHTYAGWGHYTGNEEGLWDRGRQSLIIADVIAVESDLDTTGVIAPNSYTVSMCPRAVIAGSFDPSIHTQVVKSRIWIGVASSLWKLPEPGTRYLVVIDESLGAPRISLAGQRFMPDNSPLSPSEGKIKIHSSMYPVTGLDDPVVREVTERLRRVRTAAATTQPSTQPATVPAR